MREQTGDAPIAGEMPRSIRPASPVETPEYWTHEQSREDLRGAIVFLTMAAYSHYTHGIVAAIRARGAVVRLVQKKDAVKATEALASARCVVTFHSCVASILSIMASLKGRVPTLTLQDGIIEYQHSSVVFPDGTARYRPLATDRIAVFGDASARLLRAQGVAADRIVVTGTSRIPAPLPQTADTDHRPATGDILIATANRPGYDMRDLVKFYTLLDQTVTTLATNGHKLRYRFGRSLKPGGHSAVELFAATLGQDMVDRIRALPQSDLPLAEDLQHSRAVITTPSTLTLDAMAVGLPVAHLNYADSTSFLHPAWQIRPDSDPCAVLHAMLAPTPLQKMYQRALLDDNLCRGNAIARITDLIMGSAP